MGIDYNRYIYYGVSFEGEEISELLLRRISAGVGKSSSCFEEYPKELAEEDVPEREGCVELMQGRLFEIISEEDDDEEMGLAFDDELGCDATKGPLPISAYYDYEKGLFIGVFFEFRNYARNSSRYKTSPEHLKRNGEFFENVLKYREEYDENIKKILKELGVSCRKYTSLESPILAL